MVLVAENGKILQRHEDVRSFLKRVLLICVFVTGSWATLTAGETWENMTLLTIDGERFTAEDFKYWWYSWQEDDIPFPDSPEPFVEWHLLVREANRMKLFKEPTYKHNVGRFLESRSLMMLKADAIAAKINISEDLILDRYIQEFCPRWLVKTLYFDEEQEAIQAYIALNSMTIDEFIDRSPREKGLKGHEQKWLRSGNVPENWREKLTGMGGGDISLPLPMDSGFVLLKLIETRGPDKADFKKLREGIEKEVKEKQRDKLVAELLRKLWTKYEVVIDLNLLAALKKAGISEELLKKTLISTNRERIPAQVLIEQMQKDRPMISWFGIDNVAFEQWKQKVLNTILAEKLMTWEALDRHYERTAPFQWIFHFQSHKQLIHELERKLIKPEAKVSNEEAMFYYQQNIGKYSLPEKVSIEVVENDERPVKRSRMTTGAQRIFMRAGQQGTSKGTQVYDIPMTQLDPVMESVVEKLTIGEVSPPITDKGGAFKIRLIDRKPAIPIPFVKVRDRITQKLYDNKFTKRRNELLLLLKSRSSISVDQKVWDTVATELEN